MMLHCEQENRRAEVRKNPNLNGLDYLEVSGDQRTLTIYFLDKVPDLKKENIRITGGRRITNINVVDIDICRSQDPERDACLTVRVNKPGDFSCYKLCIVALDERGRPTDQPHPEFDPRYWCLEFTFKANCPSDLDCASLPCESKPLPQPEINYLAKDYASFRQLILDRLALLVPEWQERHVPDLGIALVELLAYTGDHLSYYQDAVATEAYLDTARQRISVRRHTRLVDYLVSEGCNARAWLHLHTDSNIALELKHFAFITRIREFLNEPRSILSLEDLRTVPASNYVWFESVTGDTIQLYTFHNEIQFHTWGDSECCLVKGATRATLKDAYKESPEQKIEDNKNNYKKDKNNKHKKHHDDDCDDDPEQPEEPERELPERELKLNVGDVLIFEEILGPKTGHKADADPTHRHAVKLTKITRGIDPSYTQPIIEIEWHKEDALPFALCISSVANCQPLSNVSVARGNIILVDHGRTLTPEFLGEVPGKDMLKCNECGDKKTYLAGRFRPMLRNSPLTFSETIKANASATATVFQRNPRQALPAIKQLVSSSITSPEGTPDEAKAKELLEQGGLEWSPRYDLLASQNDDPHVVLEMNNDGYAHLRFGDGELGRQPEVRHNFATRYRVGNGTSGNVGADSITHVVMLETVSGLGLEPRNPLPATGGMKAETLEEIKLMAPYAFRGDLQRAITPSDYAVLAERDVEEVQRANARLRWTGSWYEMQVAVDAEGQNETPEKLLDKVDYRLRRYRRIAHDLRVSAAETVPLELALLVCVDPHYQAGHVKRALLERFSNRVLADGMKGFFHPDNLSFGEGVFISRIVAEAKAVTGVENVVVTKLQRFGDTDADNERVLESGVLELNPFEIARLDNDPSFPENGVLTLEMRGGR
ncbi:MAG: putative baseplate assembly protein [Trueperaceae bacterium]